MKRIIFLIMSIFLNGYLNANIVPSGSSLSIIGPTVITLPGTYRLANDISGTVTIAASNVILDLDNKTISGGLNGVFAEDQSDLVIKNGSIQNALSNGVFIDTCSNVQIQDLDLELNNIGIQLQDSFGACLTKINSRNNGTIGIQLDGSSECLLQDCNCFLHNAIFPPPQGRGINIINASNDNILERCFCNENAVGIRCSFSNNNIFRQCICNQNATGILCDNSSSIVIIECECNSQASGISITSSLYMQIMNCIIDQNAETGISLNLGSNQCKIINNTVRGNGDAGISTNSNNFIFITDNCCSENGNSGIRIGNSGSVIGAEVINNISINNTGEGIFLNRTFNSLVKNNKCNNNSSNGINILEFSENNCFEENITNFNGTNGISNLGLNSSFFSNKAQQNIESNYIGVYPSTIGLFSITDGEFVSTPTLCCDINISVTVV